MDRCRSRRISTRHLRRIVKAEVEKDVQIVQSSLKDTAFCSVPHNGPSSIMVEGMDCEEGSPILVPDPVTFCSSDSFSFPESDVNSPTKLDVGSTHQPINKLDWGNANDESYIDSDDNSDLCLTEFEVVSSEDDESHNHELADNFHEESFEEYSKEKTNSFADAIHQWALKFKVALVAATALLLLLRSFTDHELPIDARTLLGTEMITKTVEMGTGDYLHFGFERAVMAMLRENKKKGKIEKDLKVIINIDGLPIYKSSAKGFWLIICSKVDSQKVYPIGAFFGQGKPVDANVFLNEFVNEAINLSNFGVNDGNVKVSIESLSCDTPAKAFVLYLKGHTGYESCSKCNIKGKYVRTKARKNAPRRGVVCFPGTGPFTLRKDEDFCIADELELNVKTILNNIPGFGLVTSVPLDYMHLVLLGVVKRLITLWIVGPLKVRLSSEQLKKITEKLLKLRLCTPKEFARRPRTILDYIHWKATEFRTFLLYTGPIVLKEVLKPEVYSHFLLLHCAITILINDAYIKVPSNVDYAEELFNEFVRDFATIYGEQFVSQNVHNLLHICADVRKFGPLDNFSAFRFENYMMKIKKMIRKGEKPLQQIARRYSEEEKAEMQGLEITNTSSVNSKINLKHQHSTGPLKNDVFQRVKQFKFYETSTYTINCNYLKDCCVLLKNGKFGIIENIVQEENGAVGFIGEEYEPIDRHYKDPDSSLFNISIITKSSSVKHFWYAADVYQKTWRVVCRAGIIVLPLLHNLN